MLDFLQIPMDGFQKHFVGEIDVFPNLLAIFSLLIGFLKGPQAIRGASFTQKVDKENGVKTRPLKPGWLHLPRWHESTCHSGLDIFLSSQFIQERWKL